MGLLLCLLVHPLYTDHFPIRTTPGFLLGESHRQRSMVGYSPWGYKTIPIERNAKKQNGCLGRPYK